MAWTRLFGLRAEMNARPFFPICVCASMQSLEANPFIASHQNIWQTNAPHSASVFVIDFFFAIRFVLFTLGCALFMRKTRIRKHVHGIKSVIERKNHMKKMHWQSLKVSHPFVRLLKSNWMFYIWWHTPCPQLCILNIDENRQHINSVVRRRKISQTMRFIECSQFHFGMEC